MFSSARRSTPLAVFALCLLLTLPSDVRAQASGSLTGVVVPDLPPEVSPGEEISFTPPSGSEGGTWTLCGVVAEPAEDSEQPPEAERPRPAVAQVGLKPDPALKPLSEAQALGLALASAMNEPS
ncbi:MAG TPA: hypothetical protein VMW27_20370, partial [Thermoanaerobaculia bacterium]|nr:hypothetical protein [Thermoanaerobaculia bacterium]